MGVWAHARLRACRGQKDNLLESVVPPLRLQGSRSKLRSGVCQVLLPAEHSYWPKKVDSVPPLTRKDFSLTKMVTILVLLSAF